MTTIDLNLSVTANMMDARLSKLTLLLLAKAIAHLMPPGWVEHILETPGPVSIKTSLLGKPCLAVWTFGSDGRLIRIDIHFDIPADDAVRFASEHLSPLVAWELTVNPSWVVAEVKTDLRSPLPAILTIHYGGVN